MSSDKRRGLGRGLGALIPSTPARPSGERPVDDVFFGAPQNAEAVEPAQSTTTAILERPETEFASGDSFGQEAMIDITADGGGISAVGSQRNEEADSAWEGQSGSGVLDLMPVPGARFAHIPVTAIRPNPRQPREVFDEDELAELVLSIREIGVLQPIVVRPIPGQPDEPEQFELVMGERRWRASQEAGLDAVPAIVRETADDDLLRDALLENLHRSQLNPLEEASAYQQLLDDFGCTHEELASRIGRSRPQISNTIRLLRLPAAVQRRVAAGVLSAGHARALLGMETSAAMEALAQRIVSEGLSVRAAEEIVALADGVPTEQAPKRKPRAGAHRSELNDLATRLGDRLDTKVGITLGARKGRLTIEFASVDDLNRIVTAMSPEVRGAFANAPVEASD